MTQNNIQININGKLKSNKGRPGREELPDLLLHEQRSSQQIFSYS